jgi:hypothetical protein
LCSKATKAVLVPVTARKAFMAGGSGQLGVRCGGGILRDPGRVLPEPEPMPVPRSIQMTDDLSGVGAGGRSMDRSADQTSGQLVLSTS